MLLDVGRPWCVGNLSQTLASGDDKLGYLKILRAQFHNGASRTRIRNWTPVVGPHSRLSPFSDPDLQIRNKDSVVQVHSPDHSFQRLTLYFWLFVFTTAADSVDVSTSSPNPSGAV